MSSGMRTSYIVKVSGFVKGRRIDGEYSGGATMADARKEAAEFVAEVKCDPFACVKICKSNQFGRLTVVEVALGV